MWYLLRYVTGAGRRRGACALETLRLILTNLRCVTPSTHEPTSALWRRCDRRIEARFCLLSYFCPLSNARRGSSLLRETSVLPATHEPTSRYSLYSRTYVRLLSSLLV